MALETTNLGQNFANRLCPFSTNLASSAKKFPPTYYDFVIDLLHINGNHWQTIISIALEHF